MAAAAQYLSTKGAASIDKRDFYGNTALMRASTMGYTQVAELIIAEGANVNLQASDG